MKALTVKDPWASLILLGKDVENRTWPTKYRGPLAIHAARSIDRNCPPEAWQMLPGGHDTRRTAGMLLGVVNLVDCVRGYRSLWAEIGCWHWVLARPRRLPTPVPRQGRLGLWNVDDALLADARQVRPA